MDEISSTEFRKRYTDLKQETRVRSGKHTIGVWIPASANGSIMYGNTIDTSTPSPFGIHVVDPPASRKQAQAERDAILRRMNAKPRG